MSEMGGTVPYEDRRLPALPRPFYAGARDVRKTSSPAVSFAQIAVIGDGLPSGSNRSQTRPSRIGSGAASCGSLKI
jgi:hypothetical protein